MFGGTLRGWCGSMTGRTVGAGGTNYGLTYDSENRLTGVSGGATATFVFDGDGKRVKGTVAGVTTVYIGDYYEVSGTTVKKYYSIRSDRSRCRSSRLSSDWLCSSCSQEAASEDVARESFV